jgi:hypothetical protein
LYLGAGVAATWPALREAPSDFLAYGVPRENAVTPGDYLQTTYNLWLPGHQLERGARPWIDPYSFQPEAEPRTNFPSWPFALVFWPLHALLGTVGAWNTFVLLSYVGAGGFAALWLRALGLPLGAALVGGLAFALAPYRSAQTAGGHLLGPIAMLLPLALWALERRRMLVAAATIASIPLSGQVHLALGALAFFALYALARARAREAVVGVATGAVAGLFVYLESIRDSVAAAGRSFAGVERYSAEAGDFVSRDVRTFETFVFVGWLTPLVALAGLLLLAFRRRYIETVVFGLGLIMPVLFALGANTPIYEPLWQALPGLEHTRVPERLMPIACLAIAALVAVAVARLPWETAALAAALIVAVDLRAGVELYQPLRADEENGAYAALRRAPPGRLLEVPVLNPETFAGSVYLYYSMQAPRERPLAYSTTAPREARAVLRKLDCRRLGELDRLGIRYIAYHHALLPFNVPHAVAACLRRLTSGRKIGESRFVDVFTFP